MSSFKRHSRRQSIEVMLFGVVDHIADYLQKIEEKFHVEAQNMRFGKKGKSCFLHSFLTQAPDGFDDCTGSGSLLNVCVRLFCNDSTQNTEMAILSTPVALDLFLEVCPFSKHFNTSKDGANNFGLAYQLAYPRILEQRGLTCGIADTPETGAGKDRCDQDGSGVGSSITRSVDAGMDAISAATMCEAADRGQGPERGKINREIVMQRGTGPGDIEGKLFDGRFYRLEHVFTGIHLPPKYEGTWFQRYGGLGTKGKFVSRAAIDAAWPTVSKLKTMKCSVKAHGAKTGNKVNCSLSYNPC